MKLLSLFDGSGGFPLAASMCGITPVMAAEVEPYPIAVTKSRFPKMKHLGNVQNVRGGEIEPVDIITFGSPCQDLSVAGKRKGLKHAENGDEETTRSGLFMEAVRIIKEMREATNGVYPRYAVWENVPGAFSSNKGEDFRTVLDELIKISEPDAVMPDVPKAGWAYADCYSGDGWSLAYRVFDAQYWGVPQRRRRIYLVADFRGGRAGEILFEREGVRGYFAEGRTPWQTTAGNVESGAGTDDRAGEACGTFQNTGVGWWNKSDIGATLRTPTGGESVLANVVVQAAGFDGKMGAKAGNIGYKDETAPTLNAGKVMTVCVKEQHLFENHSQDTRFKGPLKVCPMLPAQLGTGGNNTPFVVEGAPVYCLQGNGIDRALTAGCNGKGWKEGQSYTLNTIDRPAVVYVVDQGGGESAANVAENLSPTLACTHGGEPAVAYCMATGQANAEICKEICPTLNCNHEQPIVAGVDCRNMNEYAELYPTLQAKPNGGQSLNYSGAVRVRYIVRRLTPTECARLQGFPDKWGHPDKKETLTDDEYRFWLEVRNTHAAIYGKAVKEYTKEQMLIWYNKLHSDSAEYKMWGNGIALPNALYVMQGIAEG